MKIYDITPIGKPRMTRADKWKQRPEVIRYRAFCDEARLRKIHLPDSGAHVTFVMPMPQSWSQKRERNTQDVHISQSPTATIC